MVGFPDIRSHSKSGPFANQPLLDHIRISDLHYNLKNHDSTKILKKFQPNPETANQVLETSLNQSSLDNCFQLEPL